MAEIVRMHFAYQKAAWVDQVFEDKALSPTARICSYYISSLFKYENFLKDGVLECCPNCEILAERSGLAKSEVLSAVRELATRRHINARDPSDTVDLFWCFALFVHRNVFIGYV
ncbi:hypothetical protein [Brucella rhizosphaerae]|uniref:hypothetical protein n=1 Tax=Brucella rhizosphaerae TaxID=571254 RepID=UPI000465B63E|nr:hypothetical protein [Brucella rhizosphaerae]